MELAPKLRELLGNEIVADDPEIVAAHSGDKWFAAHEPDAVVFARSTEDVSKLLEFSSRENSGDSTRWRLWIRGRMRSGTRRNCSVVVADESDHANQLRRRGRDC